MMNILQIMAMVGQQNSGGKRIQTSIAGKTLPCFKAGDNSPAAVSFAEMLKKLSLKKSTKIIYEFKRGRGSKAILQHIFSHESSLFQRIR